jgi:hypothetical protein
VQKCESQCERKLEVFNLQKVLATDRERRGRIVRTAGTPISHMKHIMSVIVGHQLLSLYWFSRVLKVNIPIKFVELKTIRA